MNCLLCEEEVTQGQPWMSMNGDQRAHRECLLRSTTGGIGHLVAHEFWCLQRHDPDAGLTYRQSALLCDAFVKVVGVDEAVKRG